ncbi:alpha/beta fold hydrolase [Subtercola boreus]|uniref:alpha/beta fold hydrolase n=1 Tax=Subtercola boreus TaxID=120213 RepID=UPI00155958A3|nr:alpha/beta hydrolase [Subtercola boreus]
MDTSSSQPVDRHLTKDIAVRGGVMRVGEWSPASLQTAGSASAPVVLALHSLAGAHLSWAWLADQLPEARIVAPDLRGRGLSADLPGPYGIDAHIDDVLCVADALQLSEVTLIGHSLGAFVALGVAAARPGMIVQVVLVDGGLPLTVPLSLHTDDLVELVCGRPKSRVDFAFSSRASHRRFWQLHPALAKVWSPRSEEYADYLVDEVIAKDASIEFRPIACSEAIDVDTRELSGTVTIRRRLKEAPGPLLLLTAARDLSNHVPGIYAPREVELTTADVSHLLIREVREVNHYTIVESVRGASAIARFVREGLQAKRI